MIPESKIKKYKSLQNKKYRNRENLFIVEGIKLVSEAIKNTPETIVDILANGNCYKKLQADSPLLITETDYNTIKKISSLKTPQECIAVLKLPELNKLPMPAQDSLWLALDSIKDPGNLGTIIRMADWFGIDTIICSNGCVDCFNPKVVQATMGSIFRINIFYLELVDFLLKMKETKNLNIYGTTLNGEILYNTEIDEPSIIVMGNESIGISQPVINILDKELLIPNYSKTEEKAESLNVSTATSIILSEIKRRKIYSK